MWIVYNLLDIEDLIWLLRLADDLDPGVELSTHYHQVLRLGQGVDRTPGAKRTSNILCCSLYKKVYITQEPA